MMNSVILLLCVLAAAYAAKTPKKALEEAKRTELQAPGKQHEIYKNTVKTVKITPNEEDHVIKGLDVKREAGKEDINNEDMKLIYWHPEMEYARKRIVTLLDTDGNQKIEKKDFTSWFAEAQETDYKKRQIQIAVVECQYLRSNGLKQSCFADQFATYTALVLDDQDVDGFITHLGATATDATITEDHLKSKFEKNLDMVKEEVGFTAGTGVQTQDLKEFMIQECLVDDFRVCRSKVEHDKGNIDFDNECLVNEVDEYVMQDLTEMDMSVMFSIIDNDNTGKINKGELEAFGVPAAKSEDVIKMIDAQNTGDNEIDYGEFRTYMKSGTVVYQSEKVCTEKVDAQLEEIECLLGLFLELVSDTHTPIWLVVPDIEQVQAFEIIDLDDDNGKITSTELEKIQNVGGPLMHEAAILKFIEEFDSIDDDIDVDMEEFNEYMDIPHMVYGTCDCLLKQRDVAGRGECYPTEIVDIIDNIKFVSDDALESWFKYYAGKDDKIDKTDNIKEKLGTEAGTEITEVLFLAELGQGGEEVSLFEWTWHMKQQALADRWEKSSIVQYHTGRAFTKYQRRAINDEFMIWLKNAMTEYDITQLFTTLDKDNNKEITPADEGLGGEKTKELLKQIDALEPYGDADDTVNYREFWMWFSSDHVGEKMERYRTVRIFFENECTIKQTTQQAELDCYKGLIVDATKLVTAK